MLSMSGAGRHAAAFRRSERSASISLCGPCVYCPPADPDLQMYNVSLRFLDSRRETGFLQSHSDRFRACSATTQGGKRRMRHLTACAIEHTAACARVGMRCRVFLYTWVCEFFACRSLVLGVALVLLCQQVHNAPPFLLAARRLGWPWQGRSLQVTR